MTSKTEKDLAAASRNIETNLRLYGEETGGIYSDEAALAVSDSLRAGGFDPEDLPGGAIDSVIRLARLSGLPYPVSDAIAGEFFLRSLIKAETRAKMIRAAIRETRRAERFELFKTFPEV